MASKGNALKEAIKFTAKKLTAGKCQKLCRELDLDDVEIDTIMQNNPGDAGTQKHKMLSKWKEKHGNQATLEKFLEALKECELIEIRDELFNHLEMKGYGLDRRPAQETASGTDHQEASIGMQSSHVPKESPTSFTHSAQQQIPRTAKTCAEHQPTDDRQPVVTSTGICTGTAVTIASSAVNHGPDQNATSQVSKAYTDPSIMQSGRNHQQPSQEALAEESQQATVQSAVQQEVSRGSSSSSVHQDIEQQTREMVDQGNHKFVQNTPSTTRSSSGIQDLGNHDVVAGNTISSVRETQGAGHAGQHHTVTQESDTTSQHEKDGKESIPAYPIPESQSKPTDTFQHWKDSKLGHRLKMFTREEIDDIIDSPDGLNIIENGVFGMIYKGQLKFKMIKRLDVAVKEVRVNSLTDEGENDFKKRSVANFRHPYIIPVIGICGEPSKPLFIAYSYLGSNLEQALKTMENDALENSLNQRKCLLIVTQVASALMYLHRQSPQIIHLDVKPSNILLDSSFNARLADVGFIKDYDLSRAALSLPGTPGYQDISMLEEWPLRPTNDLFSLGVVMLQMLTGMPAIIDKQSRKQCLHTHLRNEGCFKAKEEQLQKFALEKVWLSSSNDKELTSSFVELVGQCLQLAPEQRISMEQLHEQLHEGIINASKSQTTLPDS